jgi:hypothetical protein
MTPHDPSTRQRGVPPEAVGVAVLTLHNIVARQMLPAPSERP